MGNTQTPDGADHEYYRRPADGMEPQRSVPPRSARQDSVQIIEDGSGPDAGARLAGAGVPQRASVTGPDAGSWPDTGDTAAAGAGRVPQSNSGWRRLNPYLAAAWGVVALLLLCGVSWLTGLLTLSPEFYDPSFSQDRGVGEVMAMNLASTGPVPFLFGLLGAFTLLVVQAVGFRRKGGS